MQCVAKALADLFKRRGGHPCCRQLDGQGNPVERAADAGHQCRIVAGEPECPVVPACPVDKELYRFRLGVQVTGINRRCARDGQ